MTLNLEEILADYTNESIMITPNGIVCGIAGLTPVVEGFFEEFGIMGNSAWRMRSPRVSEMCLIALTKEPGVSLVFIDTSSGLGRLRTIPVVVPQPLHGVAKPILVAALGNDVQQVVGAEEHVETTGV